MTEPDVPNIREPGAGEPARKRRGLSLPPRGQALTRLQDLERVEPLPEAEDGAPTPAEPDLATSDTARSTAVNQHVQAAVRTAGSAPVVPDPPTPRSVLRPAKEPTTRITVDMPDSLHRKVSFLSVETRRSIKDLVIEALEAYYFQSPEGTAR